MKKLFKYFLCFSFLFIVGCATSVKPNPIGPLKVNISNYVPIPNSNGTTFLNNLNNALSGVTGIEPQFDTYTFSTLPTATNNKIVYCQDCSTTSVTCAGSGTGTLAFYTGSSWLCLASSSGTPAGTTGQIQYNNSGSFGGFTASGDATITPSTGTVLVTKTNGTPFGTAATDNTGTSGATIPLLNGTNTWANSQTFSASLVYGCSGGVTLSSGTGTITNACITASCHVFGCADTTANNSFTVTPGAGSASVSGTGSDVIAGCVFWGC